MSLKFLNYVIPPEGEIPNKAFKPGDKIRNIYTGRVARIASAKQMPHKDGPITVFIMTDENMWSETELNRCWDKV